MTGFESPAVLAAREADAPATPPSQRGWNLKESNREWRSKRRSDRIVQLLAENPGLRTGAIAQIVGCYDAQATKSLLRLQRQGYATRDIHGRWAHAHGES